MRALIATWNRARDVWETSHVHIDLFSGLSAVYSETWPTSGMTQGGLAYQLPAWEPRTGGSESSSLLPTPEANTASNGGSQHPDKRRAGGHSVNLQDVAEHLLPTPTAHDAKGTGPSQHERHSPMLTELPALLPTPRATDGTKGGPNQRGSSGDLMLPSAVQLLATPRAIRGGSSTENLEKLLPTPTATAYGSNQSPSPGATVRPSLDSLFSGDRMSQLSDDGNECSDE